MGNEATKTTRDLLIPLVKLEIGAVYTTTSWIQTPTSSSNIFDLFKNCFVFCGVANSLYKSLSNSSPRVLQKISLFSKRSLEQSLAEMSDYEMVLCNSKSGVWIEAHKKFCEMEKVALRDFIRLNFSFRGQKIQFGVEDLFKQAESTIGSSSQRVWEVVCLILAEKMGCNNPRRIIPNLYQVENNITLALNSINDFPYPRQEMIFENANVYKSVVAVLTTFKPEKSCIEYVRALDGELGLEKLMFILSECLKWLKSIEELKIYNNINNLDENEHFALTLYTWDLTINGKKEENFYYNLNKVLLERNLSKMEMWKGYLFYLQSALSKMPKQKLTVFRGIPNFTSFSSQYSQGRKIHWSAYSSSTTSLDCAKQFATSSGVIMKISILNGKSVQMYSAFPVENEILLSPNMRLLVVKEFYTENGWNFIDLAEQCDELEAFVF